MVVFDRTNLMLMDLLQRDGRAALTDLARAVQRGESTVRERIAALEAAEIIQGYRANLDYSRLGFHASAVLRATADLTKLDAIEQQLRAIPNVVSAHLTTGEKPLLVELRATSLRELERLMEGRLAALGLRRWGLEVVLRPLVDPRPLQVSTGPVTAEQILRP